RNEAFNARYLKHTMAGFPEIHVPAIYPEYSSARVLTMEFVSGVKITDRASIDAAGLDPTRLAQAVLRASGQQVLFDGFFHGDPHPGNVLVDLETGKVIFLDLGMMGETTEDQRMALADLIWSLKEQAAYEIGRVMLQLSTPFRPVDQKAFIRDV